MSQGYLATVTLSGLVGQRVQFQNATVHDGGDTIDTSSSLNADGSVNEGFSDVDGDLGTFTVDVDTVLKDALAMYLLTMYEPLTVYADQEFTVQYNGHGYAGIGIYVIDKSITFRVPGEARVRMSFRSIYKGYELQDITP